MGYEKRQFLYGMDFDTEERLVEPGFSRKNVNVRIGASTDAGVLSAENVQGNTFIPNVDLPSGDNKVIGSYWDKLRDLSYYFVYNDEGNHGVFEYNHVEGKIKTVMIAEVLNLKADQLITGINVVEFDKDNHFLYFSDGFNPPRKFNIQKAKSGTAYSSPIKEEVIDAIKYPPLCAPTASYETVGSGVNYLNDVIWQFKAAYVYDDKEESAFSPISVQILPDSNCLDNDTQGDTIRIVIPKGGELVERVIVAGREGNLNDFLELTDQEVVKFDVDSDGNYIYDFRNDGVYNALSLPQSNKLFDNLPQTAKAQEYIESNRIAYGNITEGYDNVEVDFDLEVTYEDEVNTTSNTIKGVLRISNNDTTGFGVPSQYENFQPITKYNGTYVYGGMGINPFGSIGDQFEKNLDSDFKQGLPLGGFVLYLAGTEYYSVSTQVENDPGTDGLALQDSKGVYNSDTISNRNVIRKQIVGSSSGAYTDSRTYSQFQFQDIPDGTYIMRVASNLTTSQDLLDPERGYQKTSPLLNRIGFNTTTGSNQSFDKELSITVQGGQILDDIEVVIADLSSPLDGVVNTTKGLAGYLVDFEAGFDPDTIQEALGQQRIELSLARVSGGLTNTVVTDHNGFFFQQSPSGNLTLQNMRTGNYDNGSFQGYDLFDSGDPVQIPVENNTNGTTEFFVIDSNNTNVTNFARTNVLAEVRDTSGNPVKGVTIVSTNGEALKTDALGQQSFILYAPGDLSGSTPYRVSSFYAYTPASCDSSFNFDSLTFADYISQNNENNSTTTSLPIWIITVSDISGQSRLKNGGSYSFGLVYYDRANRSGATNVGDNSELSLPFYTEVSPAITTAPIVGWQINSLAPDWATHYQWVRTPNTAINDYIQWYTDEITYTDSSGDPSDSNNGTILELDISNLTSEYKTANPDSVLVYDFVEGDRVRLIKDNSNNYFGSYIDLKVLSFETGILKVENRTDIPDISSGVLFEIYTPKLDVEEDIYYEVGECLEVLKDVDAQGNTISYHQGRIQDQDPLNPSGTPATGIFIGGDTYYRTRNITATGGIFSTSIDSQLFSDFWQSRISDIGRPNIIDNDAKTVSRISTIYYSARFIPETNINGLNSYFDTSFETYDRKYGSIQKLYSQDKRLDCYQETKVGKILVEENVIFDQFDQGTIASSEKVLSKIIYYKGEFGTLNPESFTENEGRRYFFDIRNGKVLRLSNDGLTPISDKKMHSYFESKSNFYSAFGLIPEVWGCYDENFDEYIIAFGSLSRPEGFTPDDLALVSSQAQTITEERNGLTYTFDIIYDGNDQGVPTEFDVVLDRANGTYVINSSAGDITLDRQKILAIPPETLAYSERTGFWTSFYTYDPECMVRVGIDFLSFRNGQAYLHNTSNAKRNSFYGEDQSSEVWVVFNQAPSNVKVYQALSEESDTVWEAYEILTQNGQESSLILDDFSVAYGQGHTLYSKENIHYAALWKDINTPNVAIPLLEGDSMRDVSVLVKLINGSTDEERLFAASMNYSLSERSNR